MYIYIYDIYVYISIFVFASHYTYLVSRSGKYVITIVKNYNHSIYVLILMELQCNTVVTPWLVFQQKKRFYQPQFVIT